jgi:hypothetical protein
MNYFSEVQKRLSNPCPIHIDYLCTNLPEHQILYMTSLENRIQIAINDSLDNYVIFSGSDVIDHWIDVKNISAEDWMDAVIVISHCDFFLIALKSDGKYCRYSSKKSFPVVMFEIEALKKAFSYREVAEQVFRAIKYESIINNSLWDEYTEDNEIIKNLLAGNYERYHGDTLQNRPEYWDANNIRLCFYNGSFTPLIALMRNKKLDAYCYERQAMLSLALSRWENIVMVSELDVHNYCQPVALLNDEGRVYIVDGSTLDNSQLPSASDIIWLSGILALKSDGTVINISERSNHDTDKWKNVVHLRYRYGIGVGIRSDGTVLTVGNLSEEAQRIIAEWKADPCH